MRTGRIRLTGMANSGERFGRLTRERPENERLVNCSAVQLAALSLSDGGGLHHSQTQNTPAKYVIQAGVHGKREGKPQHVGAPTPPFSQNQTAPQRFLHLASPLFCYVYTIMIHVQTRG